MYYLCIQFSIFVNVAEASVFKYFIYTVFKGAGREVWSVLHCRYFVPLILFSESNSYDFLRLMIFGNDFCYLAQNENLE